MNFYTDLTLIRDNPDIPYATFLYPCLGVYPEPLNTPISPMSSRFDIWRKSTDFYRLCDLASCDAAIFPFEFYGISRHPERDKMISNFVGRAKDFGKWTLLFAYGDEYVDFPECDNLLVFQPNLTKTSLNPRHHAMPNFIEDLFSLHVKRMSQRSTSRFRPFQRRKLPTISFCGFADSVKVRRDVISVLEQNNFVQTNFILRDKYFGGAWDSRKNGYDFRRLHRVRAQYVKNLISSDYVLCVRGGGNYSSRIYEALCCGKIPVLLNTDCVLPGDFELDYSKYFLIVESEDMDSLGEMVLAYDKNLSDNDFLQKQFECRKLWCNYLSPQGYYGNLIRVLPKLLNK